MESVEHLPKFLTPSQVAAELSIDVGKVYEWIKTGQLVAVDLAEKPQGRKPRYRISRDSLVAFLGGRTTRAPAAPRLRRKKPAGYVGEFY